VRFAVLVMQNGDFQKWNLPAPRVAISIIKRACKVAVF
jgi:hypothetical protein